MVYFFKFENFPVEEIHTLSEVFNAIINAHKLNGSYILKKCDTKIGGADTNQKLKEARKKILN